MAKGTPKVQDDIARFGWHVVKVLGDEEGSPFAYTVGLVSRFDHPEIAIFGLNDDLDVMHRVLNALGARVQAGKRFEHGARCRDVLPGVTVRFARLPKSAYRDHLGQALAHHGSDRFAAVQCIWPDPKGRLPWDPKVMPPVLARQPVFLRPDAGPRDPKWPFEAPHSTLVITSRPIATGKQPVRLVGRFEDGTFQFVCETTTDESDVVVTTLGWMLDHDPGLARAAKLEAGQAIRRKEPGTAWRKVVIPAED